MLWGLQVGVRHGLYHPQASSASRQCLRPREPAEPTTHHLLPQWGSEHNQSKRPRCWITVEKSNDANLVLSTYKKKRIFTQCFKWFLGALILIHHCPLFFFSDFLRFTLIFFFYSVILSRISHYIWPPCLLRLF